MQVPALAAALVAAALASASAQSVSIAIIEHGIYTADVTATEPLPNGVGLNRVTNLCHVATTTTVPALPGLHFGLRFRLEGQAEGHIVALRQLVTYPNSVQPAGGARPITGYENAIAVAAGEISFVGYSFDRPWEFMAGPWIFRILEGDRLLAEQHFQVIDGAGRSVPQTGRGDCFRVSSL
jgi:hypothetical protein